MWAQSYFLARRESFKGNERKKISKYSDLCLFLLSCRLCWVVTSLREPHRPQSEAPGWRGPWATGLRHQRALPPQTPGTGHLPGLKASSLVSVPKSHPGAHGLMGMAPGLMGVAPGVGPGKSGGTCLLGAEPGGLLVIVPSFCGKSFKSFLHEAFWESCTVNGLRAGTNPQTGLPVQFPEMAE